MFCLFLKCMCMYIEIARVVNEHVLRIRVNVCMWVYEYMYIYTHIHLYTYIYTCFGVDRARDSAHIPKAATQIQMSESSCRGGHPLDVHPRNPNDSQKLSMMINK